MPRGAVHQLAGLVAEGVELVLDVHVVGVAGVAQQLEQRLALLVGLLDQGAHVAHVVLQRALLAGVEAAADAEHEQQQHDNSRPDRDRSPYHEGLAVGRRTRRRACGAQVERGLLAGPVRRRRTEWLLAPDVKYDLGAGCPSPVPPHGGRGTPRRTESRTQMRTPDSHERPHARRRVRARCPVRGAGVLALGGTGSRSGSAPGGFGVVWRAHDTKLERDVAVKVVPRERDDADRPRVEREALAAARLNHPGIVALYEIGRRRARRLPRVRAGERGHAGGALARGGDVRSRRGPDRPRALRRARARPRARGHPPRREARRT